ncbi:MAG: hypothetical protein JST75_15105 [Bacteroidetes bacterium]|nr:hypothetical protein [Bacteroidota bacterium]
MRKKYFLIAGIVWLVLAGLGLYYYDKPHANAGDKSTDISITAGDLFSQFQQDENAANKKFLDKIIEVKGTVMDVQQSGNTTSVQLDGGSGGAGINCSIAINNEKNKITLPEKGSVITIKGRCAGMLMDVNLVDCVIQ